MTSSSQNATFEHCISRWIPRPFVSGPATFITRRPQLLAKFPTSQLPGTRAAEAKSITVPLRFIFRAFSQFLQELQQGQPLLF